MSAFFCGPEMAAKRNTVQEEPLTPCDSLLKNKPGKILAKATKKFTLLPKVE